MEHNNIIWEFHMHYFLNVHSIINKRTTCSKDVHYFIQVPTTIVNVQSGTLIMIRRVQEHIIEERGEYRTSVPSLSKVLWGQLGANTSETACG